MDNQEYRTMIDGEAGIASAIVQTRSQCTAIGFDAASRCRIETAVSELARNIIKYAGTGEMVFRAIQDQHRRGIEVRACDDGPGIEDLDLAMRDHYTTGRSLGLGLPGVRRMMDDFDIDSKPGKGTRITIRKWL